jgi:hypothetical protein
LERLRKILKVKKASFLFHQQYMGKSAEESDWRLKVETRVSQTLKYLNTQRILQIIDYDPAKYLRKNQLNLNASYL